MAVCTDVHKVVGSRHEKSIVAIAVLRSPSAIRSMHMQKQVPKTVQSTEDS